MNKSSFSLFVSAALFVTAGLAMPSLANAGSPSSQVIPPTVHTVGTTVSSSLGPILFDNGSIWTADRYGQDVYKVDPATGATQTYTACSNFGGSIYSLVMAGAILWVDCGATGVAALNAQTGAWEFGNSADLSTFTTGCGSSYSMALSGSLLWVSCKGANTLVALNAVTGAPGIGSSLSTSTIHLAFAEPTGIVVAGSLLWVTDTAHSSIVALDATTGAWAFGGSEGASTFLTATYDAVPWSLGLVGNTLWVANSSPDASNNSTLVAFNATTGAYAFGGTLAASTVLVGPQPNRLTALGSSLWVTDSRSNAVIALDGTTGHYLYSSAGSPSLAASTFSVNTGPHGITTDGSNVWIAGDNGTFTKLSLDLPGAPIDVKLNATVVTGVNRTAAVSWSPPISSGSAPITEYTVTTSPGGKTCTSTGTSCSISNLDLGTTFTFTVTATTVLGTSVSSDPATLDAVTTTPTTAAPIALAKTGDSFGALLGIGSLLLGIGTAALALNRRRRSVLG